MWGNLGAELNRMLPGYGLGTAPDLSEVGFWGGGGPMMSALQQYMKNIESQRAARAKETVAEITSGADYDKGLVAAYGDLAKSRAATEQAALDRDARERAHTQEWGPGGGRERLESMQWGHRGGRERLSKMEMTGRYDLESLKQMAENERARQANELRGNEVNMRYGPGGLEERLRQAQEQGATGRVDKQLAAALEQHSTPSGNVQFEYGPQGKLALQEQQARAEADRLSKQYEFQRQMQESSQGHARNLKDAELEEQRRQSVVKYGADPGALKDIEKYKTEAATQAEQRKYEQQRQMQDRKFDLEAQAPSRVKKPLTSENLRGFMQAASKVATGEGRNPKPKENYEKALEIAQRAGYDIREAKEKGLEGTGLAPKNKEWSDYWWDAATAPYTGPRGLMKTLGIWPE